MGSFRLVVLGAAVLAFAGCTSPVPRPEHGETLPPPVELVFGVVHLATNEARYVSAARPAYYGGSVSAFKFYEARPSSALTYFVNGTLPACPGLVLIVERDGSEIGRFTGDGAVVGVIAPVEPGEYSYRIDHALTIGACEVVVDIQYEALFEDPRMIDDMRSKPR